MKARSLFVDASLTILLLFSGEAGGATNQVSSLNVDVVQNAINSSKVGDTVLLPAGTGYWNVPVTISKAIAVQGAGIDQTLIVNVQSIDLNTLTGGQAISIYATSNTLTRISGLSIDGSQTGGGIDCGGDIYAPVRIDHCKISNSRREGVKVTGIIAGLVDHCTFINNYLQVGDYPDPQMNTSWQLPLTIGTTNCVVIEDCVFLLQNTGTWDPWGAKFWSTFENGRGARLVLRYNHWTNFDDTLAISPVMDVHGNQDQVDLVNNSGSLRGTRSLEMYNNIFDNHVSAAYTRYCRPTFLRGGTIMIYSNAFVGKQVETTFLCEEEDGPSRFNWLTNYPGYDQHFLWMWNNTVNGSPVTQLSYVDPSDAVFLLAGTNVYWTVKPGYTPLAYPHPLITFGISLIGQPPTAVVTAKPDSGPAPLVVAFSSVGSASRTGVALTYAWTFGDGSTSTEASPSHGYLTNALYKVRLDISDGVTTASTNLTIRVGP